jgi:pilus assembly protein TadC
LLLYCLLFGLGMGLCFFGLFWPCTRSRFPGWKEKGFLLDPLRPLTYLRPVTHLINLQHLLGPLKIEELLSKAGHPWGMKPRNVLMLQYVLVLLVLLVGLILLLLDFLSGKGFIILLFWGITVGFLGLVGVLTVKARMRERKIIEEEGDFSETVLMLLRAGLGLREALEEASKTTVALRPYLHVCLNRWLTGKTQALLQLGKEVGVPSFQVIVDLLIQAVEIGDDRIADFLEENKRIEDKIKEMEISARSKLRPILLTFQMIVPFVVIMIVLFYPLVVQVEKVISSF